MILYRNYPFFLLNFLPLSSLYLIRPHESSANEAVLSMKVHTAQEFVEMSGYRFYCGLKLLLRRSGSRFISKVLLQGLGQQVCTHLRVEIF